MATVTNAGNRAPNQRDRKVKTAFVRAIALSTLTGMGTGRQAQHGVRLGRGDRHGVVAEVEVRTTAALKATLAAPKQTTVVLL